MRSNSEEIMKEGKCFACEKKTKQKRYMETKKCYKRCKGKQNYTITNKTKGKKLNRNQRRATGRRNRRYKNVL